MKGLVYKGMRTPWGKADFFAEITPWLGSVDTPSHGGLKLHPKFQAALPHYLKRDGGWYEEDSDWALVYLAFEKELLRDALPSERICVERTISEGKHISTVREWYWREYELFTGRVLAKGESRLKDEYLFLTENAGLWGSISALSVRDTVRVSVTRGASREAGAETRKLVVPYSLYDERSDFLRPAFFSDEEVLRYAAV